MKRIFTSLLLIAATFSAFAQAPTEKPFILIYRDTVSGAMRPVRLYQEPAQAAVNQPPVAHAGTDQSLASNATSTTLNGSATDADGTVTSYHWTQVAGTAVTITSPLAASTTVTGLAAGNSYTFRLTVTDDSSATDADDIVVTVAAASNQSPTVNAGTDQSITLPTNSVTLTGTASDGDGTISTHTWSKLSGGAATITDASSLSTTVTGLVEGTYQFQLSATDNDGATSTDVVSVIVNPAPTGNEVVKFNFAPAGSLPITGYTSVYGDPRAAVLTATGNGVSISTILNYPLWSAGSFTFSSGNTGKGTGSNTGIRPDSVMIGEFFRYNNTFVDTATSKCFQIWGLTPGATYVVKMGGSRDTNGVTDPHQLGEVEYRVMGVPQVLNNDDNTSAELTFTNVVADANGCISVFVGQKSGDLHFGFIGWLEIDTP